MAWPGVLDMDEATFVQTFGGIYEHSPWLAQSVFRDGLKAVDDNVNGLLRKFAASLSSAPRNRQLDLIRAHPDLAGRAALAGRVTANSAAEQHSAGLDQCSPNELARFTHLNAAYLDKFGFPFVLAVKGLSRTGILAAFERRLENSLDAEFEYALHEINRIARLRLEAL